MLDLKNTRKVVIKIGSSLLVKSGRVRKKWLNSLLEDVKFLKELGLKVIIVSSGAVALGRERLKVKSHLDLAGKRAAAAIGQVELISSYQKIFARYQMTAAQLLLTNSESANRSSYLNIRQIFNNLLENNIIPIVNENDTVATEEVKIGDNDRLAARIAQMVEAELLILLSDIDGLYDKNPKLHKDAKFIAEITKITKEVEGMASGAVSKVGTGGMIAKIQAVKMAFNSGCNVVIAKGLNLHPVRDLLSGGRYTIFKTENKKISSRKRWIVDSLNLKGEIIIDEGAKQAIIKGGSLLPIGVKKILGNFAKYEQILIKDLNLNHIATGIVNYSSEDARLIIGKKSSEIKHVLGRVAQEELIHRDNLVLIRLYS